jgi:hypothetical protein
VLLSVEFPFLFNRSIPVLFFPSFALHLRTYLVLLLNSFVSSFVVKGVVCKKNVANKRMPSKKEKPRILILGGALEYQRVSNLLSSFDTLLQQVLPVNLFSHVF